MKFTEFTYITVCHAYTHSDVQNCSLGVVVLANNTILCLLDEKPAAANCSIHFGADSSNLTNSDSAIPGGVITLTSNLSGDTTYYVLSTAIGLMTVKLYGSFNICDTQDLMESNITLQPQSSCGDPIGNHPLACFNGVTPGSTVVYHCANSSLSGQSKKTCQSDGTWSGTTPSCVCDSELSSLVVVTRFDGPSHS